MPLKLFRKLTKGTLIVLNILAVLFFLLGCYGGNLDAVRFWPAGFFVLASFYFLLILIGFLLFWLFAKPKYMLISLIGILFAWKPLRNVVRLQLSPNFVAEKHPANLRVMSWNVEHFDILEHKTHPERKHEMLNIINEYNPDIAIFQEMVGSDGNEKAINYLPDILNSLKMKDYHYSFNPKLDFDNDHHFGIIIMSKYPIISKHTFSYEPKDYNSIFQYADIAGNDDTFRIFNVHLQSLRFTKENLDYINKPQIDKKQDIKETFSLLGKFKSGFIKRKFQSDRIRKAMDESPYPIILGGDFNDVPNSYAYNTIGKNMKNAFVQKGTGIGRTFYGISPTLRIDNIFVDNRFNVEQFVRVHKKLSDHYPIVADLFFKKD